MYQTQPSQAKEHKNVLAFWIAHAQLANTSRIGWARLWDGALNCGGKAVRGLQMLSRAMSHHGRGSQPCQLCDTAPLQSTVLDHILCHHGGELPGTWT